MLNECGLMALIMLFVLGAGSVVLGGATSFLSATLAIRLQYRVVMAMAFSVSVAMLILWIAFASHDFSVAYVAAHSNTHLPLGYRLAALWGGHEGSLLLWLCLLCYWMVAMTVWRGPIPELLWLRTMSVLGGVASGLALFVLCTSNPFARLLPWPPIEGRSLMPLLQDPGLISHPPILYAGYVGCSAAFALTIAALWEGRLDTAWTRWMRPWVMAAWSLLTLGIVLGSWWAYRELGWGGYWYWDPVENASFMPWLASTALMHSLMITSRVNACKVWTVLLSILAFSLSLLGTFLVRSGILVSVHAFAVDPLRGVWLLVYLGCVIGGALLLFVCRAATLKEEGIALLWGRRPSWMMLSNVLMLLGVLVVLLGTVYPLFAEWVFDEKLSVGPPYFAWMMTPLTVMVAALLGLAMWSDWQKSLQTKRLYWVLLGSVGGALALSALFGSLSASLVISWALALWVVITTWASRCRWWVKTAHTGFALMIVGIALSSTLSQQKSMVLGSGAEGRMGDLTLEVVSVTPKLGANYQSMVAHMQLKNGHHRYDLFPERRYYPDSKTALAKVAIKREWWRDIYVVLGQKLPSGQWAIRLYEKPGVWWIWLGGLMMAFSGLFGLRRKR